MSNQVVYVVVEYLDDREEPDLEVKGVYTDKDKAIDWVKSQGVLEDDEEGPEYVGVNGDVIYCVPSSADSNERFAVCESRLHD